MTESQDQNELFERSKRLVPGGVHSPVRSFKNLHTTPRFIKEAQGPYLYDVEGRDYIDFCMSFGPLVLGHKDPEVLTQLHKALDRGWSYGACEPYSLDLAGFLLERLKFVDQIRFVNSGTEAVMTALRLARGVSGKDKILKFNGCYHGHMDSMLIQAGSGLAGEADASSAGVPKGVSKDTLIVELGDIEAVHECFKREGDQIACIVIEPLPANNGLIPQSVEFLKQLRQICDEHNCLLIFDEVISGFRVAFGGMAEKTGVIPDIVTYGKIIGGGLPVGALAAKESIMNHLAPMGQVYQAGTLSANPLAMVGGLANIRQCTPKLYEQLANQTKAIVEVLEKWLKEFKDGVYSDYNIVQYESLFWFVPDKAPKDITEMPSNLNDRFHGLFKDLLDRGIYLSPNAYEIGFVSKAHDNTLLKELEKRLWS